MLYVKVLNTGKHAGGFFRVWRWGFIARIHNRALLISLTARRIKSWRIES